MKPNPDQLFGNLFDDPKSSNDNFYEYCDYNLGHMKNPVNNIGGRWNTRIIPTQIAFDAFAGIIGRKVSDLSDQLAGTRNEDTLIANWKSDVSSRYNDIVTYMDHDMTKVLEFYPHGITGLTHCDKAEVYALMKAFRDKCTFYNAVLPAPLVLIFVNYVTEYELKHGIHTSTMGGFSGDLAQVKVLRLALEKEEAMNIRFTGNVFPFDIPACLIYHKFDLLFTHADHPHTRYPGELTPGKLLMLSDMEWNENLRVRLRNLSGDVGGSISIAILNALGDTMPVDAHRVKTGHTYAFKPSYLQTSPTSTVLKIQSNNITANALYEVEIFFVN